MLSALFLLLQTAAGVPTGDYADASGTLWVPVGPVGEGPSDRFILKEDLLAPRRATMRVWTLVVYRNPANGVFSRKSQEEYDCVGRRWRSVFTVTYDAAAEPITGDTVASVMTPVVPGTVGMDMLRAVCGR